MFKLGLQRWSTAIHKVCQSH